MRCLCSAAEWDVSREEMERLDLAGHQKAGRAWEEGRFDNEVVPYGDCVRDVEVRPDTTLEKMATLKPLLGEGGRLTAATSSQIADGAAVVLVASEAAVERFGLTPRAPHPHHDRHRQRPGPHPHRTDLVDDQGHRPVRAEHRRRRPVRVPRGLRVVVIAW